MKQYNVIEAESIISDLLHHMDATSRNALVYMARRFAMGFRRFGDWKQATDARLLNDISEELIDALNYLAVLEQVVRTKGESK